MVHACVQRSSGQLRLMQSPADCRAGEDAVAWNQVGPKGDRNDGAPVDVLYGSLTAVDLGRAS